MTYSPRTSGVSTRNVLIALKQYLIANAGFTATTCFIGRDPDKSELAPSLIYAVIIPGRHRSIQHEQFILGGTVRIIVWACRLSDQAKRADVQLTDSTLGLYAKTDAIIAALELADLANGTPLLCEPMRLDEFSEPKPDPKNPDWLKVELTFSWRFEFSNS